MNYLQRTMEFNEFKYVYWEELQREICSEMDIEYNEFRNYHEVVGGGYKDLWHVWLRIQDGMVKNNCIVPTYFDLEEIAIYGGLDHVYDKYGTWITPFVEAVDRVFERHDGELYIFYMH